MSQTQALANEQLRHVLIFRNTLLPFSETFIAAQASALTTFEPVYVGMRRAPGLDLGDHSVVVCNEGGLAGRAMELRCRLLGPAAALIGRLSQYFPHLIHAHFGPDGANALSFADALRIPLITTFHGWDVTVQDTALPRSLPQMLYRSRRTQLQRRGALFLGVSEFIRKRLIDQGFPSDRTITHYTGVDLERFSPGPAGEREDVILFVGRLTEKKGAPLLLRAFTLLAQRHAQFELVLIGDGEERPVLEADAKAAGIRCRFLGKQPPSEVMRWMRRARLLSVPSITASNGDAEGFGMVFAEAQACGTPVVSFASGGIPEAVRHGDTGLLAPEGDWETLSRYLEQLLTDSVLWQRYSDAGRRFVSECFDLRKQTARLERIYSGVIAEYGIALTGDRGKETL